MVDFSLLVHENDLYGGDTHVWTYNWDVPFVTGKVTTWAGQMTKWAKGQLQGPLLVVGFADSSLCFKTRSKLALKLISGSDPGAE